MGKTEKVNHKIKRILAKNMPGNTFEVGLGTFSSTLVMPLKWAYIKPFYNSLWVILPSIHFR